MMPEISMNVLDVAENSGRAGASLIQISVNISEPDDLLEIVIEDDGCGMTPDQVQHVIDPFFTTRTTRKVGLGVPFYKMAAENTGGQFFIESQPGIGTKVYASFGLPHIDRMPLGDINGTIHTLVVFNTGIDFLYTYTYNGQSFSLDTREFRQILEGVPLDSPDVSAYIRDYLEENKREADGGVQI